MTHNLRLFVQTDNESSSIKTAIIRSRFQLNCILFSSLTFLVLRSNSVLEATGFEDVAVLPSLIIDNMIAAKTKAAIINRQAMKTATAISHIIRRSFLVDSIVEGLCTDRFSNTREECFTTLYLRRACKGTQWTSFGK